MEDFLSDIFTTFIGAVLAFVCGVYLYYLQKRSENITYLSYAVSSLVSQTNILYPFKHQIIIPRVSEVKRLKEIIENKENKENIHLKISEISQHIQNGYSNLSIDIEKLAFLVSFDPNLILLLNAAINSSSDATRMVTECNARMQYSYENQDLSAIWMMIRCNENLAEQLDHCIYMVEKSASVLIEVLKTYYADEVKIREFVIEDDYKSLRPPPIESWEKYNWSFKKQTCLEKLIVQLKKLNFCRYF